MGNISNLMLAHDVIQSTLFREFLSMKKGTLSWLYLRLRSNIQRRASNKEIGKDRGQRLFILKKYYDNHILAARWAIKMLAEITNVSERYMIELLNMLDDLGYIQREKINGKTYYIFGSWKEDNGSIVETYLIDTIIRDKTREEVVEQADKKIAYYLE